jgi:hypothetical protein
MKFGMDITYYQIQKLKCHSLARVIANSPMWTEFHDERWQ